MNIIRRSGIIVSLLLPAIIAGCGGGVDRTDLSGTVTFDGQPIVYGEIQFLAQPGQENTPSGFAEIIDGKYTTAEMGQGIAPGKYTLRISAYDGKFAEVENEDESVESDSTGPTALFIDYEIEAELTPPEQNFEVSADAEGHGIGQQGRSRASDP